jgi:hypothetical protein
MAVQKNAFDGTMKKLKTSIGPVDRKKAVLEAEKGETVLTKLSENDNIYELKAIGGKKHSAGGTPLDLPTGDDNGKTASFIYSDNKKLLMKDKSDLEFFGMESKKGMTPAEISRKHIEAVAKSKAIIKDMYADKIQKASAVKNLDNSRFALSALALWQESKKGMKDGFSEQFAPFFDKTKTTPEDIFKVDAAQQEAVGQQMQAAFGGFLETKSLGGSKNKMALKDLWNKPTFAKGGETGKYTIVSLPKAAPGEDTKKHKVYTKDQLPSGVVPKKENATNIKVGDFVEQADGTYKKVGVVNTEVKANNTKTSTANEISTWSKDPANAETLRIANQALEDGLAAGTVICTKKDSKGNCVDGNIKILGTFNPDFKTKIALSKVINQSGKDFATDKYKIKSQGATGAYSKANAKGNLDKTGSFVAGFTPDDYEKRYLFEKAKGQGLSEDEAYKVIDETFADNAKRLANKKEFTTFLGVSAKDDAELMSTDFYKNNFSKITQGIENKLKESVDYRPAMGDDSKSGYEHFDAFGFSSKPDYENEAAPGKQDTPVNVEAQHLNAKPPVPGKWDFRRQDIASLNRAVEAKNAIRKYDPWSKVAPTAISETTFYSPERAIAAVNSQLGQGIAGINSFATPGQAAAATSEMQGNAYEQVADQISNYADKNVGLFNAAADRNTQLANIANAQDAANATSMHDKRQTLKQQFDNSMSQAKDKITELSNAAWTNASNIFNLNQTTNNFKKDINTGIIYNSSGKEVTPKTSNSMTVPELYAKYVQQMPGVDPDTIAKMVMGEKRGDFKIDDKNDPNNQVKTPEELIRLQQNTNS